LEEAYDDAMTGQRFLPGSEDALLYGTYNPLSVTLTHLLNRKSGLAWTSYSHTALPVPVFATGVGSEEFNGYYDNTEVAKKIAKVMGVDLGLK
jgi:alkaline phosphatase